MTKHELKRRLFLQHLPMQIFHFDSEHRCALCTMQAIRTPRTKKHPWNTEHRFQCIQCFLLLQKLNSLHTKPYQKNSYCPSLAYTNTNHQIFLLCCAIIFYLKIVDRQQGVPVRKCSHWWDCWRDFRERTNSCNLHIHATTHASTHTHAHAHMHAH